MQRITIKYDFIKRQSAKAWCLGIDRKTVWVSKNEGRIDFDKKEVDIPLWLAIKAGIEAYGDES
jgi:hypothetical protein